MKITYRKSVGCYSGRVFLHPAISKAENISMTNYLCIRINRIRGADVIVIGNLVRVSFLFVSHL